MRICTKCGEEKDESFFNKRTDRSKMYSWCKQCVLEYSRKKHSKTRQFVKTQAVQYKGGVCESCGQVVHPCVFDFHHVKEKSMVIGRMLHYGLDYIKDELDKCILVCANCHRMIHFVKENV